MHKCYPISLLILLCVTLQGIAQKKTDREDYGFRGRVASFTETRQSTEKFTPACILRGQGSAAYSKITREKDGTEIRSYYSKDNVLLSRLTTHFDARHNKTEETLHRADGGLEYRITYEYDANGSPAKVKNYNKHDSLIGVKDLTFFYPRGKEQIRFDKEGTMSQRVYYDKDDHPQKPINIKELREKGREHIYDEKGREVMTKISNIDGRGGLESVIKYKYDGQGNKVEEAYYNKDDVQTSKQTFNYDRAGHLLVHETRPQNNQFISSREVFKYNDAGQRTERLLYQGNDGVHYTLKTRDLYNARGDKAELTVYDDNGNIKSRNLYDYDDRGNLLRTSSSDGPDTMTHEDSKAIYSLFDKNGNWVKRLWWNEQDNTVDISEREIEYFE